MLFGIAPLFYPRHRGAYNEKVQPKRDTLKPARPIKNSASRRLYNFSAPFYDAILGRMEASRFSAWRKVLWSKVQGRRILEVGVGTGLSFPHYPRGTEVVAIDFSPKMLKLAEARAQRDKVQVDLRLMDVEEMTFEDNSFDAVISSLVFCAVPDPPAGLQGIKRILRPGSPLVMLEHVLSDNRWLAPWMRIADIPLGSLTGEHISRRTVETVKASGFQVDNVTHLTGIFRLIEARKRQIYV
jgi:phosphatidylethanolamine/phosphatidyl-N-methylethanolamine N-methyltransferase